ncbi:MAG: hypothetical protein RIF33_18080 [Cyclobacteriaceae bacterium]
MLLLLGTSSELLLLGHFEDNWQLVPVIVLGIAIPTLAAIHWLGLTQLILPFRGIMLASILSGVLGVWFHLEANYEFETEMYPTLGGWKLLSEMMTGAIPALAPGSMVVVGLIGLLYTYEKSNEHE